MVIPTDFISGRKPKQTENKKLKPKIYKFLKESPYKNRVEKNWGSIISGSGRPDLEIVTSKETYYVELKDKKGKLSTTQEKRIADFQELGVTIHVVDDYDTFVEWWNRVNA